MITTLRLKNVRGFNAAGLEIGRLLMIAGPNGSGKTTILEGLRLVSRIATAAGKAEVRSTSGTAPWMQSAGPQGSEFDNAIFTLGRRGPAGDVVADAEGMTIAVGCVEGGFSGTITHSWTQAPPKVFTEATATDGNRVATGAQAPFWVGNRLRRAVLLKLDARRLAEFVPCDSSQTRIEYDGFGLAAVLADLKLRDDERFEAILQDLRTVLPRVRRVRIGREEVDRADAPVLDPAGGGAPSAPEVSRKVAVYAVQLDIAGTDRIPARAVSEGTLLVLGLITLLHTESCPPLVLLDDVDAGLHPKAQRLLVDRLRALLARYPLLQVIATTHSPFILDACKPEEVALTYVDDAGRAYVASLADLPELGQWRDEMLPGELWTAFGERWVEQIGR